MSAVNKGKPHVILMCGVSGSGKTTYAVQKEREGYVRLSIDEEMWSRYGRYGVDYPPERYGELSAQVEMQLRKRLSELVRAGRDVVVDFSFWSRQRRNEYRLLIERAGGHADLIYLKADLETLRARLARRNLHIGPNAAYVITDEILQRYFDGFEEPFGEGETVIAQKAEKETARRKKIDGEPG